jgi:pimeloyl-ACP methyl ester carboxylesterase
MAISSMNHHYPFRLPRFSVFFVTTVLVACYMPFAWAAGAAKNIETQVELITDTGKIYGTELVPDELGGCPVVLLIAGSGPTDGDGNSSLLPGSNNSLKYLAEALAREGIASLRFDKRGIGRSRMAGFDESKLRFEHYVDDAAEWVTYLSGDERFTKVVVAGHSEGSLIGMLAAAKSKAAGYISIAGIARRADEVLLDQMRPNMSDALYAESRRIFAELRAGRTVSNTPESLARILRPSVQPYLISWIRYAPRDTIAGLKIPTLIIQGTNDIQVEVSEAKALAQSQPKAQLVIIDGMNHVLKMVGTDRELQKRSYSDPALPIAPRLVSSIAGFVKTLR